MGLTSKLVCFLIIMMVCFAIGSGLIMEFFSSVQMVVLWGFVVFGFYGVFTIYMLSRRLRNTLADIRMVRYGSDAEPMEIDCFDEIGQLAREFSHLHAELCREGDKLVKAGAMLEQKVWYRTKDLHLALKQMEKTARTDELTGLANRGYLKEGSRNIFERAGCEKIDLACLMVDIDNFKQVNDLWGHASGDRVITFAGDLLRGSIRSVDFCARYGGDEFVVFLLGCSADQAIAVAERMRMHFGREVEKYMRSEEEDIDVDNREKMVLPQLSIGVATLIGDGAKDVKELMSKADEALYKAKKAGRNCVVKYIEEGKR